MPPARKPGSRRMRGAATAQQTGRSEWELPPQNDIQDVIQNVDSGLSGALTPAPSSESPTATVLESIGDIADTTVHQESGTDWQSQLSFTNELFATSSNTFIQPIENLSTTDISLIDHVVDPFFAAAARPYSDSLMPSAAVASAPTLAPGLLYCPIPWPDDMLASPKRQFLWQYFLQSIEANGLCVDWEDVGHMPGFQDPFVVTIPHLAITNPVLREAVLTFSMFQYNALQNQLTFDRLMVNAWRSACQGLRAQLTTLHEEDGWGVLSMISACCLLHWCAPDKREEFLRLAAKLAVIFLKRSRSSTSIPSVYRESILTSFRWTTISALCSLQPPSRVLSDEVCDIVELDSHEIVQNYSSPFQSWISHPIYAFSARLVNPLLRIGHLAELQLSRQRDKEDIPDESLELRIVNLEETLLSARDTELDVITSPTGATDPLAVASLNEAMHAASVILFYTRFRGLPFTAPLIRRQVQIAVSEICKTRVDSRVSYAVVFPLFIAGCEAVDSQVRDIIADRIRTPKGLFFDRGDIAAALRHIWEIRDLHPGLTWPHWVNKGMRRICH
ncbi:hypothetical protein TruAng_006357 [Truncatella angustata]|nr:hypothetical protein TruAng_006357 [Truncatella angustata]